MKQIVFAVLVLVWVPTAASAALYIGTDLNVASVDFKQVPIQPTPESVNGFDLHLGERFGAIAGELGYSVMSDGTSSTQNGLRLSEVTLDGFVYLPIFGGLNGILTAGGVDSNYGSSYYNVARYVVNGNQMASRSDITVFHGDEFSWRAGTGLSFPLGSTFEVHAIGRYESLNMKGLADNDLAISAGVNIFL